MLLEALKGALPKGLRHWLSRKRFHVRRNMLWADRVTDFGVLRRVTPYRIAFGWHRGQPVDRYYIEKFLAVHSQFIRGHVLEVCDADYTKAYGGDRVTQSSIVDIDESNADATVIDDLTVGAHMPDDTYDCIVCTQVLLYVYDFQAAIRTMHRVLKPGGTLLVTVPGLAQMCTALGAGEDFWRFTRHSARRAFTDVFGEDNVEVEAHGNIMAVLGILHGLVVAEFTHEELDHQDPDYEVVVAVVATKRVET